MVLAKRHCCAYYAVYRNRAKGLYVGEVFLSLITASVIIKHVIYIGHKLGFRGGLSVKENLSFYRDLRGRRGVAEIDEAMDYLGLGDVSDRLYTSLSHGQRQRGALCRLMTEEAQLWLLDEPTGALDQQGTISFRNF